MQLANQVDLSLGPQADLLGIRIIRANPYRNRNERGTEMPNEANRDERKAQ